MGKETRHTIVNHICDDEVLMLILSSNKHIVISKKRNIKDCDVFLNTEDKLCRDQNSHKHIYAMISEGASSKSKVMQILTLFITAFETINNVLLELCQCSKSINNFRNRTCTIIILIIQENPNFHDKKLRDNGWS